MMHRAPKGYWQAWVAQARRSPWISWSLLLTLLIVIVLVAGSLVSALSSITPEILRDTTFGGLAGFLATALGAGLVYCVNDARARTQDIMLGLASGMMLAASAFSLILPGLEAARQIVSTDIYAAAVIVVGLMLGTFLMLGLDFFTPHEHEFAGPQGPNVGRLNRVWLFVFAITLHNLPEGMAIGVGFAGGDWSVGLPLATAIAIQDVPEGLAVALSLRTIGLTRGMAILIAIGSGLMEPIGALIGLGMSSGFALAYPLSMGLAAGAMIFVVSHEIIPETHSHGHQTAATLGLMVGFALMTFLDTALG